MIVGPGRSAAALGPSYGAGRGAPANATRAARAGQETAGPRPWEFQPGPARLRVRDRAKQRAERCFAARGRRGAPRRPFLLDRKFCPPDTRRLEDSHDMRAVRELLRHANVETTRVCTHALNRDGRGVRSPLDRTGGRPGDRRKTCRLSRGRNGQGPARSCLEQRRLGRTAERSRFHDRQRAFAVSAAASLPNPGCPGLPGAGVRSAPGKRCRPPATSRGRAPVRG
jgi:hypothetical protein